jgi:hypothetical protein
MSCQYITSRFYSVFIVCLLVSSPIDDNILFGDHSVRSDKEGQSRAFTRLTPDDLPGEGGIVSLDAEFVTLNQVCASLACVQSLLTPPPVFFYTERGGVSSGCTHTSTSYLWC